MINDHKGDMPLLRRVLKQASAYWPHLLGILLLDLLSAPLALLAPVPLKIVVDSVIGSQPLPGFLYAFVPDAAFPSKQWLLIIAALLLILLAVLSQVQALGSFVLKTRVGEELTLAFRTRLFRHAQRLSFLFHDTRGTTDSIYRIQYDTPSVQWIIIHGLLPLVTASVTLVATIYVIVRIDWQLALIALAVSPFLFASAQLYRTRMHPKYRDLKGLESSALGVVQEVLTSLRVVKAFGREEDEQQRFLEHSNNGMRARIRLAVLEGGFGLFVSVITAIGTAAVLLIGVQSVLSGVISLGELLMVITYLAQLYGPLRTVSTTIATVQSSVASAERAFELLDELPDVAERPHALPIHRAVGKVEFRGVSFSYDGKAMVLDNLNLIVPAGTRVGIAGRTGAGKTTLISLLMRFYDPTKGQILLDGVDLRDYKLADLRNQFAIVLQEPVLFSTTISENIAYAAPGATELEVIEAAKAANAHEFIMGLPEGYQTKVGERGMRLSGGERQRISLARAFLKDAPILLLDEPTSSVDVNTETLIMQAMDRLMNNRTTFMIAHRLSTLEECNMRVEIEDGRIVATRLAGEHTPLQQVI